MPETLVGTSFESFSDAAASAFKEMKGNQGKEGLASATVVRMWLEKGGFVGRTQYKVEIKAV
jgi:flavin-binding protein dodecin